MEKVIKYGLFFGILILLALPLAQMEYPYFSTRELDGSFSESPNPVFSVKTFLSGEYQKKKTAFLKDHIGFRNTMVRLSNQIDYSLFNELHAKNTVIGKDGYLYEKGYITEYNGGSFVGLESIRLRVEKLAFIKGKLEEKNIELLMVIAPGKGSYYPEFIPDKMGNKEAELRNYTVYKKEFVKQGIDLIDFNEYFKSEKHEAPFLLMPKTGIHWSKYGEYIAADSIINYFEAKLDVDIPNLILKAIDTSLAQKGDIDIEEALNLLFPLENVEMGYPKFKIESQEGKDSLKVLTIADSFYWGMFNFGLSKKAFNRGQFWYYAKQIYPDSYKEKIKVDEIDIIEGIEENNAVMIMCTDATLHKFAFGFIDSAYDAYLNEEEMDEFIQTIKSDSLVFERVQLKAIKRNISLEEMLRIEAKYMLNKSRENN